MNCQIGTLGIGDDFPVRVVAELGICHRGNLELAKEMVHWVRKSGADFVKFEAYQLDSALSKPYRAEAEIRYSTALDGEINANLFEAFKGGHLTFEELEELIAEIKSLGMPFLATACSIEEADFLISQGACAVKLSSGEIDHYPLIHHIAKQDVPLFIDTAKTYFWEIVRAYEEYLGHNGSVVVPMVNPPGYPAPSETADLRRIRALGDLFRSPIGYSCHSPGRLAVMAAIGLGARVVEKPLCPDKTQAHIEYVFSENMHEYGDFVCDVRDIDSMLGRVYRGWSTEEMKGQLLNRHGVVAKTALSKGTRLTKHNLAIARPGLGVRPEHLESLAGRTLNRSVQEGEAIGWEDV